MRQNKVYICVHTLCVFLFCELFTIWYFIDFPFALITIFSLRDMDSIKFWLYQETFSAILPL